MDHWLAVFTVDRLVRLASSKSDSITLPGRWNSCISVVYLLMMAVVGIAAVRAILLVAGYLAP